MATQFLSPEIQVTERATSAIAIRADSPSTPAFLVTATRGPINRAVAVSSPDDYESVYGGDDGGDGIQSITGFFDNGGLEAVINRVAHYTNIADATTLSAVAASTVLQAAGTAATVATKTSANTQTFDLSKLALGTDTITLIAQIDGDPADTATLAGTRSTCTAPGAPGGIGTMGHTLIFSVLGVNQTYTVPASPPTTAAEWAADIQSQLSGVSASVVGGAVVLTTDAKGSSADVSYVSATGTAGADSGFGAGPVAGVNAGPNDFALDSAVTAAEIAAVILSDWTGGGGVATSVVGGAVKVDTVSTGAAASISAVTGTAATAVGFPGGLATGADAGQPSVDSITLYATSEGEHGNGLAGTVERVDKVLTTIEADLLAAAAPFTSATVASTKQMRVGMQLLIEDGTNVTSMRVIVTEIRSSTEIIFASTSPTGNIEAANTPTVKKETFNFTEVRNGVAQTPLYDLSMSSLDTKFYFANVIGTDPTLLDPRARLYAADEGAAISNTEDPRPSAVTAQALTGGLDGGAIVDNDYVGSSVSGLGLNALDDRDDFSMTAIPGINTVTVHNGLLDYAALREDHVAVMDAPENMTPAQVVTYKNVTANLFGTYGVMYVPYIRVVRQSTGVVEDFPAAGYALGVWANNDRKRNVSEAPSGVEKGQMKGVIGVARNNEYSKKANRDTVMTEGINCIWSRSGRGVLLWGQNTLDPTSDRGAVGVRRSMIYLRKNVLRLSEFVLFEINTPILRGKFRGVIRAFFKEERRKNVIKGSTDAEAFFIICDESNNPPTVVNSKKFVARLGVNLLPGIEFGDITIERDTRALDDELAAAA